MEILPRLLVQSIYLEQMKYLFFFHETVFDFFYFSIWYVRNKFLFLKNLLGIFFHC